MRTRFVGIQIRIFLAFGLALAVALSGGGWAVAAYFGKAAERQAAIQQANLLGLLASAMDDRIATYLGSLSSEAAGAPSDLEAHPDRAKRWLEGRRSLRTLFEDELFLATRDGNVLAGLPRTPVPEIVAARLRSLAASGRTSISEAYRIGPGAGPSILMVVPATRTGGQVQTLLVGAIDVAHDDFLGKLAEQEVKDAGQLAVIDDQHRILLHRDSRRVFTRIGAGDWEEGAGKAGTGVLRNAAGHLTLVSAKPLQVVPWTLAAILPESQVTLLAQPFRRYLQGAVDVAVVLSLLLTWGLSHRLTQNLEDLARQLEGSATRDPSWRLQLQGGRDETGLLVDAFNGLLARLEYKRTRLLKAQAESDEELAVARHVLERLVAPGLAALPPGLHMETLQVARINGDACTYQEGPAGLHFGILCDATGHGLAAGISTLPAVQAFLSMVPRDVPLDTMYREINRRIHQLMPVGRFLCLLLIRLDLRNGTLSMLNAGLPDAILCTPGGSLRRFASRNLPAGIRSDEPAVVETVAVAAGDRLLACTDGVSDLLGAADLETWLLKGLHASPLPVHRKVIHETLALATGGNRQRDDLSWSLWEIPPLVCARICDPPPPSALALTELDEPFRLEISFQPQVHSARNVVPEAIRMLTERGMGAAEGQVLALALTEALTNAVDHGLLHLDPDLKEQGFEAYEALRKLHLAGLQDGQVRFSIRLRTRPSGILQALQVEVEDTGPGFDWHAWDPAAAEASSAPSGRGLLLIRALSQGLSFNERGNQIRFTIPCG